MLISLFILLTMIIFAVAMAKIGGNNYSTAHEKIVPGFFIFIILLSIASLLIPPSIVVESKWVFIFFVILATIGLRVNFSSSLKASFFSYEIVLLFIIVIFYEYIGAISIRFHSSPDVHGVAATVGTFTENFSYHSLRYAFMDATGLKEAVHLGQPTPLLDSVWNIPDTRLRYTSDMIFTVGRLGLPLLGALYGGVFDPTVSFGYFMVAVGILGVWAAAFISIDIIKSIALILSKDKSFFELNNRYIVASIGISIALSPWATIFVLEGALTQLWFLVAILWQMKLYINYYKDSNEKKAEWRKNLVDLSVAPVFIAFSYPNGILLLGFISAIFLVIQFNKKCNIKYIGALILSMFIGSAVALLMLKGSFYEVTKSFLSGISGAPYNLGIFSINDLLPVIGNKLYFSLVAGPGTGFLPLEGSFRYGIAVAVICALALLVPAMFYFYKNRSLTVMHFLIIIPAVLLALVLKALINNETFHSYIYARNVVNYIVIGLPVTLGLFWGAFHESISTKAVLKKMAFVISLLFAPLAMVHFLASTKHFHDVTEPFSILSNKSQYEKIDPSNAILVSKKPDHRVSSFSLVGKVFYLTDDWAPSFSPENNSQNKNVYFVDIKNHGVSFTRIGTLKLKNKIKGPLTVDDIRKNEGFSP